MNWLLLLTTFHVLGAITAVGAILSYGAWSAWGRHDPDGARFVLRGITYIDGRLAGPAYSIVFITGILMAVFYVGFLHLWLLLGLGGFLVMSVVSVALYSPSLARQIKALETQGAASVAYVRADARTQRVGLVLGALAAAIVAVMIFKPQ